MLKIYFKIALRNLFRNRFYTAINVFGLSLGIGCSLILFQFISYHLSFDTYHRRADHIYRAVTELRVGDGNVQYEAGNSIALANNAKNRIPEVKDAAILKKVRKVTIGAGKKFFVENDITALTDDHFFKMFDYQWEQGDISTALTQPNTLVLTHSLAQKYFGGQDVIGKFLTLDGKNTFKITGIISGHPANTDIKTEIFLSLSSIRNLYPVDAVNMMKNWGWIDSRGSVFLLLADNASPTAVEGMIKKMDKPDLGDAVSAFTFVLQPLKEVHFDGRYSGVIQRFLLVTLGIIGLMLLIIACVNFINLATAQSFKRAKEIGTRKVLGSSPQAIFYQFIVETACLVFCAFLLAICWTLFFIPVLNTWLHTEFTFNWWTDVKLLLFIIVLFIAVVLGAGCYPAFLLSRFKPVNALKNQIGETARFANFTRRSLIVFQNVTAQVLIISTILITMQVKFLNSANVGFDKDSIIIMPLPDAAKNKTDYLRNQLIAHPEIKDVTICDKPAASSFSDGGSVKFDNRNWENFTGFTIVADAEYAGTFGLKILAGRNIAEADTASEYLVNETMVNKLGLKRPEDVIGHKFVAGGLTNNPGVIVGVIKDFHNKSLYTAIQPQSVCCYRKNYRFAAVKIRSGNVPAAIDLIKSNWKSLYPENVFEYSFQSEQINDFYSKEDLLNKLIRGGAIIAIFISCLGLLGLISLLTLQRTREISIRKVLGASITDITTMLATDFIRLILLAAIIASPIAWMMMGRYLQYFAYRIEIKWYVFVLSAIVALVITGFTVGYQSLKAAIANPAKSLRGE